MKLSKQMRAWLGTAGNDGILPRKFPSGVTVGWLTLRRLEAHGYIGHGVYGSKRWSIITDLGRKTATH